MFFICFLVNFSDKFSKPLDNIYILMYNNYVMYYSLQYNYIVLVKFIYQQFIRKCIYQHHSSPLDIKFLYQIVTSYMFENKLYWDYILKEAA